MNIRAPLLLALFSLLPIAPAGAETPLHIAGDAPSLHIAVTQVTEDGTAIGQRSEAPCPAAGCQITAALDTPAGPVPVTTIVTFVAQGTYVAIEPGKGVVARIREYGTIRPEPIFLTKPRQGVATKVIQLSVERGTPAKSTSALYTGARPDAYLKVEIGGAQG